MSGRTRIFYREDPKEVVVELDGRAIAVYKTVEEMIEHHVKGLLAIDQREVAKARAIHRRETPERRSTED